MNLEQYPQQNTARMEKILGSSSQYGLSSREAAKRLEMNGKNGTESAGKHPLLGFLKTIIKNGSLPIAFLGFCVAPFFVGIRVLVPALVYLLFLIVYFFIFLSREKIHAKQRARLMPRVRVMRDGKKRAVSPQLLVKGDLLLLSPGDVLYTYAHVTTDASMTVYGRRENGGTQILKHGGDCFDTDEEPFNTLFPGDIIKEGYGAAFVTEKADAAQVSGGSSAIVKNHENICKIATRVSFFMVLVLLAVSLLRSVVVDDYSYFGEGVLLFTILIATAGSAFYPVLFDLLFLHKNKRMLEKNGAAFASVADAESLTRVDSFVLSTRSLFHATRYKVKSFETAEGKRIKEKNGVPGELSLIADILFSVRSKCELSAEEEAILAFSEKYAMGRRLDLYAKSVSDLCTHTSYSVSSDGRTVSFLWGDAEALIPKLMYLSDDGKTRLLAPAQRERMLSGVRHSKKSGFHILLFAETQTRNSRDGVQQSFAEMKLLGFFALRKTSDSQVASMLSFLKNEDKKTFFVHDGENAEWLSREIRQLDGVPVLDGKKECFRDELTYFVKDESINFCIGIHLTPLQKSQVVAVLESAGRTVAAYGSKFEDHRMLCEATVAMAPLDQKGIAVTPLVSEAASVRAEENICSQVDSVRRAQHILGGFGAFAAALCASLLGRCAIALVGAIFGKFFLTPTYYVVLGMGFDLLSLLCFMFVNSKREYGGTDTLERENGKNFSFFAGFIGGALTIGAIATYVAFSKNGFSFTPGCFVFLSLLLMLNVGMWRFSSVRETRTKFWYPIASLLAMALVFLLGHLTDGKLGFLFQFDLLFWALFPLVVMFGVGKLVEIYFAEKNIFNIGVKHE